MLFRQRFRTSATASAAVLFALFAAPASAGWTEHVALGGAEIFSDPSCATATRYPGTAVCAAAGPVQRPVANRYDGTRWTGWVELPGTIAGAPSCFEMKGLDVWCGARSATGRLVTYAFDGKTWTGPFVVGGQLADAPSCVSLDLVRALCVARAAGGGVFSAEYAATTIAASGAWTIFPRYADSRTQPVSPVRCAPDGQPLADAYCIWENGTSAIVRRFVGESSAWEPSFAAVPGGTPLESLGCAHFSTYGINSEGGAVPNRSDDMVCYGIGRDHYFYLTANNANSAGSVDDYIAWYPIQDDLHLGHFDCAPAVAPYEQRTATVCQATGTDGGSAVSFELFGVRSTPGLIVGGANLPHAQFEGTPACFPYRPASEQNTVMCVFRDAKNVAYSTTGP
jgi:hypothetical protein